MSCSYKNRVATFTMGYIHDNFGVIKHFDGRSADKFNRVFEHFLSKAVDAGVCGVGTRERKYLKQVFARDIRDLFKNIGKDMDSLLIVTLICDLKTALLVSTALKKL